MIYFEDIQSRKIKQIKNLNSQPLQVCPRPVIIFSENTIKKADVIFRKP
jgi:hypothetical protein